MAEDINTNLFLIFKLTFQKKDGKFILNVIITCIQIVGCLFASSSLQHVEALCPVMPLTKPRPPEVLWKDHVQVQVQAGPGHSPFASNPPYSRSSA